MHPLAYIHINRCVMGLLPHARRIDVNCLFLSFCFFVLCVAISSDRNRWVCSALLYNMLNVLYLCIIFDCGISIEMKWILTVWQCLDGCLYWHWGGRWEGGRDGLLMSPLGKYMAHEWKWIGALVKQARNLRKQNDFEAGGKIFSG